MHPAPPTIRAYRPEDLDALIGVFLHAIRQTASADYDAQQLAAWAQADRAVWAERRASRPTFVAEIDGDIAGFSDLEPDGHIDMLYVHPAYARQGVGSALLANAERQAHAAALPRLYSEVSRTARPVFERAGFTVDAPERVLRNGQWFDRLRMSKRLR